MSEQKHQRMRGYRGVQFRRAYRNSQPLCRKCEAEGRLTVATEIDHIVELCKGGSHDPSNLQPLCADCHHLKTYGRRRRQRIDASGWPIDD